MLVDCFVNEKYITTPPYTGINLIKQDLLNHKALVVLENGEYIGALTIADLVQRPHNLVIDCLSEKPLINNDLSVENALKIMSEKSIDVLPVQKNNRFIGLLFKNDLIYYLLSNKNKHESTEISSNKLNNSTLFSVIAHDLKSPFNTLIGYSKLLNQSVNDLNVDEIIEISENINIVSQNAYNLLENLLNWFMMQKKQLVFYSSQFNMKDIVEFTIKYMELFAIQKGLKLINNVPGNVIVNADKNMISTVLRNLLSNAIKYTQEGGTIEISYREYKLYHQILVNDSGVGMSKIQISNLFKPINSELGTDKERGTGFGLLICKEFVNKHGGEIKVKSTVNKGSTFMFTLPNNKM